MTREAIILVAGMGTRLKPLTLQNHKCLTEVNGTSILENALRNLETVGCEKAVLVVGYLKDQIKNRIGDHFGKVHVVYAENDRYATTNTTASLKIGLGKVSDSSQVIVLEGDVFFECSVLTELLDCLDDNITVLEKYNPKLDGTFAEIAKDGYVVNWLHKSQRPENYVLVDKYKTVNIHKFSPAFISLLMQYLNESIYEHNGKEPLENVMMRIVHSYPHLIKGLVLQGPKWFEIDDMNDLELAESIFL